MEEEDEEEESVEEVSGKFASIPDTPDAKCPAEHAHLNDAHFCSLPEAQILFKLNTSQKMANYQRSIAAIPH